MHLVVARPSAPARSAAARRAIRRCPRRSIRRRPCSRSSSYLSFTKVEVRVVDTRTTPIRSRPRLVERAPRFVVEHLVDEEVVVAVVLHPLVEAVALGLVVVGVERRRDRVAVRRRRLAVRGLREVARHTPARQPSRSRILTFRVAEQRPCRSAGIAFCVLRDQHAHHERRRGRGRSRRPPAPDRPRSDRQLGDEAEVLAGADHKIVRPITTPSGPWPKASSLNRFLVEQLAQRRRRFVPGQPHSRRRGG